MKKFIFSFFTLTFLVMFSTAQIPNFSFENWTNMGSYENPDQWGTMNNTSSASGIYTATKGTPGNPGTDFLKLTSKTVTSSVLNGVAVCGVLDTLTMQPKSGFAFNLRPQSFTGNWQHMIFGSSQGSVSVILTKWNNVSGIRDTIATASKTLTGMAMSWESFSVNFTYQSGDYPDSCIIFIKASGSNPANGDYLWVDNLAFAGSVAGIKNNASVPDSISIFPNPNRGDFFIRSNQLMNESFELNIFDISGQMVYKQKDNLYWSSEQHIKVENLNSGTYFINIVSKNKILTSGFVIE